MPATKVKPGDVIAALADPSQPAFSTGSGFTAVVVTHVESDAGAAVCLTGLDKPFIAANGILTTGMRVLMR